VATGGTALNRESVHPVFAGHALRRQETNTLKCIICGTKTKSLCECGRAVCGTVGHFGTADIKTEGLTIANCISGPKRASINRSCELHPREVAFIRGERALLGFERTFTGLDSTRPFGESCGETNSRHSGFPERLVNRDSNATLNIWLNGISGDRPQYLERGIATQRNKSLVLTRRSTKSK
jgi:hypothetical protein